MIHLGRVTGWSYGDIAAMPLAELLFWAHQAAIYSRQEDAAIAAEGGE